MKPKPKYRVEDVVTYWVMNKKCKGEAMFANRKDAIAFAKMKNAESNQK